MTTPPPFPGFDGLMTLSRREGVDIRPTLLRVLTDLYVQTSAHSSEEARQFVELTSRLIDEVDDATRAAVRSRLAVYPATPPAIRDKLGITPAPANQDAAAPRAIASPSPSPSPIPTPRPGPARPPTEAELRLANGLSMQPKDAAEICEIFFRAAARERAAILHNLAETPLKASPRSPEVRAQRAVETLEMAAFAGDLENFTLELGESLILPARLAAQLVDDAGGEPLATALRALAMPGPVFQRVLLFLKPEFGASVHTVYRLSRLYDRLSERSALVMLAAWRGSTLATARVRFRPTLYDDERQRVRAAAAPRPALQLAVGKATRTGTGDP
ncbi:MAG: DUF2336 domain-containing protein [Bradyrhizobium sp.]